MQAISLKRTQLGWVVIELTIEDGTVTKVAETVPEFRGRALEVYRRKCSELASKVTHE